jgi:superfamily II DNA or RNA helicase
VQRVFGNRLWTRDERAGCWRTEALHYARIRALAQNGDLSLIDQVPAWPSLMGPPANLHDLRPEQQTAVDAWLAAGKIGVVVMPTGTGKTEVALRLMDEVRAATLVVAPVRDLMYQWHRRIQTAFDIDAGIVGDQLWNVRPITCTTYDSACIHMNRLGNQFAFLIFDECHHLPGPIRRDAARMSAAPFRLGLSATPERADGRHVDLAGLIGPEVYRLPLSAVAGRTLAEYEVVRIPVHLHAEERALYEDLGQTIRTFREHVVREQPDFDWGRDIHKLAISATAAREALEAWRRRSHIEDRAREKLRVLEDLFRLHAGTRIVVFTGSNAMARAVSLRFLVPCLLHHCGKKERAEILDGFRTGRYPVLVANEVLDEGVDIPEAKVAIVLGGDASTKQAIQRLGRILRRHHEDTAVLYEVVCADTREEQRSRQRRKSDAYTRTRHRQL